jgi:hypothetical protein
MKTWRAILGAACSLLVLGAGWWLLRETPIDPEAPAPLRSRAPPGVGSAPQFHADGDANAPRPSPAALAPVEPTKPAPGAEGSLFALELTVLHADGNPAGGATVVLVHHGAVRGWALTDAAGRARFEPAAGAVVLAIGGVSDVPLAVPLEEGRGARTVALPAGLVISGRVLVDGAPPVRPITLSLTADEWRASDVPRAAREHLTARVPGEGWSSRENAQTVGTDGRFQFSALPPGWTGAFEVPLGYRGRDSHTELRVAVPARDLVLRLARRRTITGRVVEIGQGAPVPGAEIAWECQSGQATRTEVIEADAGGCFSLPLAWFDDGYDRLTLRIRHPRGLGFRELTVRRADAPPGDDLGDIALLPTRVLAIAVRDREGAPVAGAVAVADDASGLRSKPTDAAGLTALEGLLVDTGSMTVWAHRYFAQKVELPPSEPETGPSESTAQPAPLAHPSPAGQSVPTGQSSLAAEAPIVVTLERSASLDVRITLPDGSVPRGPTVVVAARQELFASGVRRDEPARFGPHEMMDEVGTSATHGAMSEPAELDGRPVMAGWVAFSPDAEGRVTVGDLRPGVPFEVSVWSQAGELAWGPEPFGLRPEERRSVETVLARMPMNLLVRVRDLQGRPIEGARVSIVPTPHTSGDEDWPPRRTDAEGLATVHQLHADTVDLSVSMEGCATQRVEDVAVARGGQPFEVVLQPERTVRLFVHDASGRGVRADGAWARQGERSASGEEQDSQDDLATDVEEEGSSRWLFTRLSDEPAVLVVRVGWRMIELPHDTAVPDAELVVPAPGALRVRWDFPLHDTHGHKLVLRRPEHPAENPHSYWLTDKQALSREVFLPVMLPGDVEVSLLPEYGSLVPCSGVSAATIVAGITTELMLLEP